MTEAVEQLKSRANSLTVPERADLAYFLLTSLEPEEQGAEAAWEIEISRRVAEIESEFSPRIPRWRVGRVISSECRWAQVPPPVCSR